MTTLFLIAGLAGRTVAIDTAQVDSVVDLGEIVAVPRAGAGILGLAALRSRVVTVICPCTALGVSGERWRPRRAVIIRVDGHHYAVPVETLEDVAPFERLPLSSGLALEAGWRQSARGMVERDGEPVLVIDLAVLVPMPVALAACA